jgi:hypothetical protein
MSSVTRHPLLTSDEATRIVDLIRAHFDRYVAKYNERKFPPAVYNQLRSAFRSPLKVTPADIRRALVWKFGNTGKTRIPDSHETLISEIQQEWTQSSRSFNGSSEAVFTRLAALIGGRTPRYITVAFLLHLLRPKDIPIIDQHNFRAMNHYLGAVRRDWEPKSKPSTYDDLVKLSAFMIGVTSQWETTDASTKPTELTLDRFLMMYGKGLKPRKRRSAKTAKALSHRSRSAATSSERRCVNSGGLIRLPFGGAKISFDLTPLVKHLRHSPGHYIIQGQTDCALAAHPKPHSLDVWLRRTFASDPNTKQAVKSVIYQLVSTRRFEQGKFRCPDSGRLCKGIRLSPKGA